MVGSIATSEPVLVESVGFHMVERGFACAVCRVVQVWRERSTPDGLPLGEFYQPRFLSGSQASAWIAGHAAERVDSY